MLIRHKSPSLSISIHLYLSLYKSNPTLLFLNFQSFPDLAPPISSSFLPTTSTVITTGMVSSTTHPYWITLSWLKNLKWVSLQPFLVGGAITILKHMSSSMGRIVPYIMENKKWLKPPSKFHLNIFHLYNIFHGYSFTIMCKSPKNRHSSARANGFR